MENYNRPRRPNADTLSYLKSLPLDETVAKEEISTYIDYEKKRLAGKIDTSTTEESIEYPQMLSAAIASIDEIQNEVASLAGDEAGSQIIETISRIVCPYSQFALRKLLRGISDYMVFLCIHRFGSHVVQTILQHALRGVDSEASKLLDLDQDETDNDDSLPSIKDLILNLSAELQNCTAELSVHFCGSHALRTLLCVLGGVEEVAPPNTFRRGKVKAKKKKKKKNYTDLSGSGNGPSNANLLQFRRISSAGFNVEDEDVKDCLKLFVYEVAGIEDETNTESTPGNLQQLACDPSAGPLLIVLLRILTLSQSPSDNAMNATPLDAIADTRLGINRDEVKFESKSLAETLAKCILCWDDGTDKEEKSKSVTSDIIFGLSGETHGSHVLEAILRLSNDSFYEEVCRIGGFMKTDSFKEYCEHDVSNFVIQTIINTVRTREQAEIIIKCVGDITTSGYILDTKHRRKGIFFRVVEMASKFRVGQETILKHMRKGFAITDKVDEKLMSIEDCIPKLLCFQPPEKEGGRVTIDVNGARIIYNLLRFVPRLCGEVLNGIISKYGTDELEYIANDGLGSRCLIDGILDGPVKQKPFSAAVKSLYKKFIGRWASLSVERIGHHLVRKVFNTLGSMDDKAAMVAELSKSMNRLDGNAIGRSIIIECAIKDYISGGEAQWKDKMKKKLDDTNFLDQIDQADINTERKRKRKRKKTEE